MNTCKTCRWWGCDRKGCCGFVETIAAEDPARRFEIVADAADDTGLTAWLVTGPDFGCIRHEGEPEAQRLAGGVA